jgi:hypothetical protein
MKEESTTSFAASTALSEETDLSAAVVDNLFITLSTNNDDAEANDVYDADEAAYKKDDYNTAAIIYQEVLDLDPSVY